MSAQSSDLRSLVTLIRQQPNAPAGLAWWAERIGPVCDASKPATPADLWHQIERPDWATFLLGVVRPSLVSGVLCALASRTPHERAQMTACDVIRRHVTALAFEGSVAALWGGTVGAPDGPGGDQLPRWVSGVRVMS